MLTAIVKEGEEVICQISSCDQEHLDAEVAKHMTATSTVEISGEPEPEGHNDPE